GSRRGARTDVRSRVAARFGGARSLAPSDARTRRAFGAASGNAAEWRTPAPPATSDAPFVPDEGFLSDLELVGRGFAAPRLAPGNVEPLAPAEQRPRRHRRLIQLLLSLAAGRRGPATVSRHTSSSSWARLRRARARARK